MNVSTCGLLLADCVLAACSRRGDSSAHWSDALITGAGLVNVTLKGGGTIDGNGNLHENCVAGNVRGDLPCDTRARARAYAHSERARTHGRV